MDDKAAECGRRGVLAGVGVAGLAGVLCACGGKPATASQGGPATDQPAQQDPSGAPSANGGATPAGAAPKKGTLLGKITEIPVGGGKVFTAHKVVVTQPVAGHFKAFSAVCPHAGCTVDKVAAGTIDCPCHGSKFKVADASVAHGPAKKPLVKKKIHVTAGEIWLKA